MVLNSPGARHQNFTIKITNQQENRHFLSEKKNIQNKSKLEKTITFYAGINELYEYKQQLNVNKICGYCLMILLY